VFSNNTHKTVDFFIRQQEKATVGITAVSVTWDLIVWRDCDLDVGFGYTCMVAGASGVGLFVLWYPTWSEFRPAWARSDSIFIINVHCTKGPGWLVW